MLHRRTPIAIVNKEALHSRETILFSNSQAQDFLQYHVWNGQQWTAEHLSNEAAQAVGLLGERRLGHSSQAYLSLAAGHGQEQQLTHSKSHITPAYKNLPTQNKPFIQMVDWSSIHTTNVKHCRNTYLINLNTLAEFCPLPIAVIECSCSQLCKQEMYLVFLNNRTWRGGTLRLCRTVPWNSRMTSCPYTRHT